MKNYFPLLKLCEQHLREGHPHEVHKAISKVSASRIPREGRLPLANICRRAGLYAIGLTLLSSIETNTKSGRDTQFTPEELAEYAMLLMRSGAVNEALKRLAQVDVKRAPSALLYQAFGHFLRWDFQLAVPILEKFVKAAPSPYLALVGKANLAFAQLESDQADAASGLIEEVILETERGGHNHLMNIGHALNAQMHVIQGKYKDARKALERTRRNGQVVHSHDQFEVAKWTLILDGLEYNSPKAFDELRSLCQQHHEWEGLRDADFFSLKIDFRKERFLHLYFGTPFRAFRQRIERDYGDPKRTTYVLGAKSHPRIDIFSGTLDGHDLPNSGRMPHQLINVLLADFYQQPTVAGLFSELFPDERFDILTSPDRVHQLIRRTRRWLEKSRLPLTVHEDRGFYKLNITGEISFRVPLHRQFVDSNRLHLTRLENGRRDRFSASEVMERLEVSRATAYRFINWCLENGILTEVESGLRPMQFRLTPR